MRLLFCCEFYYPSVGGVQEVMRQIAERMVKRGHQVTVVTTELKNRSFKELNGVKIEGFAVAGNAVRGITGEVERYCKFVCNADVDAILIKAAQQWTFDALWPVFDKIRARKIFIPCGFSGLYQPSYADYFQKMPDILKSLDHLVFYANSYRDINYVRDHKMDHYSVIPNGASEVEFEVNKDLSFRDRHGIPDESFVFMTVGSLTGMKGHLEVTKAFARLDTAGRPAVLILNGNTPHAIPVVDEARDTNLLSDEIGRKESSSFMPLLIRVPAFFVHRKTSKVFQYIKIIREAFSVRGLAGCGELVGVSLNRRMKFLPVPIKNALLFFSNSLEHWVGKVNRQSSLKRVLVVDLPRGELIQAYKNADLFVFASNVEYSPLVLFESAAAGLPFLSVPVGNAAEIADWTGGGIICPASVDKKGYTRVDSKVLAKHMKDAMNSHDLLKELGQTGYKSWKEKYSWDRIVVQYESILAGEKT
jgi:glycosyltransferase involved in cell wall biosynthesis